MLSAFSGIALQASTMSVSEFLLLSLLIAILSVISFVAFHTMSVFEILLLLVLSAMLSVLSFIAFTMKKAAPLVAEFQKSVSNQLESIKGSASHCASKLGTIELRIMWIWVGDFEVMRQISNEFDAWDLSLDVTYFSRQISFMKTKYAMSCQLQNRMAEFDKRWTCIISLVSRELQLGIEAYKDHALELVVAAQSLRAAGWHYAAAKKDKEAGEAYLEAMTHEIKLEKWHEQAAAQDEKATPGISDSVVLDDAHLHEQQELLSEQGQIQPCQQVQAKKVSYVGKALKNNKPFKRAANREAEKRAEKVLWDSEQEAKKWDNMDQKTAQAEVNEATQAWDQSSTEYAETTYKLFHKLQLKTLPLSSIPEIGKESSVPELITDEDEGHE